MVELPDFEKIMGICLTISIQYRHVTDRQTDRQTDRYLATVHAHAEHRVSKLNGKINKSANK